MSRSPTFSPEMTVLECSPKNYRRLGSTLLGSLTPAERPHSHAEHMWDRIRDMAPEQVRPYRPRGRECAIVHCHRCGRLALVLVLGDRVPVVRSCPLCVPGGPVR